jgi:poly(hydroxyalkanoate) depolymerase family esterase
MARWLQRLFPHNKPIQALLQRVRGKPQAPSWTSGEFAEPRARGFLGRSLHRELSYRLFLPARDEVTERLPLLLMLHGCTQSALQFAEGTRMNALAAAAGFAVLYPEQRKRANSLRCWNWFDPEVIAGEGEAALIIRVLDDVLRQHPLDAKKVYLCGFSAGAAMAAVLEARFSGRFAACALYCGLMYGAADNAIQALSVMRSGSSADPAGIARTLTEQLGASFVPVPTLVLCGTNDEVVNPINSEQLVEQLCALDEQSGVALSAGPESESHTARGTARTRDYRAGERLLIRIMRIDALGHAWSGGDPRHEYFEAAGPEASQLIVDFLQEATRVSAEPMEAQPLLA